MAIQHELVGFRTHQTFIRGRSIILSRAEFEIDGKGIAFNLLCPFPTDSSPPSLLKTLNPPKPGPDSWRSWSANMGVGASDLLNQGKRSGDSVADPSKIQEKIQPAKHLPGGYRCSPNFLKPEPVRPRVTSSTCHGSALK